jgi:glycosyltransferase involved in cell wall biosynthesis
MKPINELKIAIVHDYLTALGGGERVVAELRKIFPQAPIYTLRYSEEKTHGEFKGCDVRVAPLSKTLFGQSALLSMPFLPNAVETLPLSEYDIVISSSSAFSKGIITKPTTLHICYCHTPMRFVWDWTHEYARENGYESGVKSVFARLLLHYLRIWDQSSADRVDSWVANSRNVADRIKKYYKADATVIYPPVGVPETGEVHEQPADEPYFLIVSRLSPYKKIDLAIEACAKEKQPLVVIGEGSDRERLESLAESLNAPVAFLGYQDDATIRQYYSHCRAFLFTGEDDFGMTPVEAMSFGKPVIAYSKGGALESVVEGKTGLFFEDASVESLRDAFKRFSDFEKDFKPETSKKQAEKFSVETFHKKILAHVEQEWKDFNAK